jgi:hypothetical protein
MPQPYRGVRVQHTVRLPADLHRAVVGEARQRRWTVNDFIVQALHDALTVEVPEPVGVRHNQNVYDDDGNVIAR